MNVAELKAWISSHFWDSTQIANWVQANFFRRKTFRKTSDGSVHAGLPVVLNEQGKLDVSFFDFPGDARYVKRDGTNTLTGEWDIGEDRRILAEGLRARDGEGLKLEDDAGTLGIFIEDATGNVAIGHTAPASTVKLDVRNGNVRFGNNESIVYDLAYAGFGDITAGTRITHSGDVSYAPTGSGAAGSTFRIAAFDNAAFTWRSMVETANAASTPHLLLVKSAGNVSVGGTNPPISKLHVYENTSNTSTSAGLTIEQDGAGDSIIQFLLTNTRRWVMGVDNSDDDKFKISSTADVGNDPAVTIDVNGNMGLGVTSPFNKLHVRASEVSGSDSHADDVLVIERNGNANLNLIANDANESTIVFSDSVRARGYIAYSHGQDSLSFATAGVNAMLIDSNRNVYVGADALADGQLNVSGTQGFLKINRFQAGPLSANIYLRKSRSASVGSHTIVQNGDALGTINFQGSDGSSYVSAVQLVGLVDGTPGTNDMPGRFEVRVSPDGSASPAVALTIHNNKNATLVGTLTAAGINVGEDTLSRFEDEETWETSSLILMGSISNPTGITYSTRHGRYTRVNNLVTLQAQIDWTDATGGSGMIRVPLPFQAYSAGPQVLHGILISTGVKVSTFIIPSNGTYAEMWTSDGTGLPLTFGQLRFGGSYYCA